MNKSTKQNGATVEAAAVREVLRMAGMDRAAEFIQRMIDALQKEMTASRNLRTELDELKANDQSGELARLGAENGRLMQELESVKDDRDKILKKQTNGQRDVASMTIYLDQVANRLTRGDLSVLKEEELQRVWDWAKSAGVTLLLKVPDQLRNAGVA